MDYSDNVSVYNHLTEIDGESFIVLNVEEGAEMALTPDQADELAARLTAMARRARTVNAQ